MDKEFIIGSQGRNVGSLGLVPSDKLSGKPTGQGFGAARKGPAVQGKIESFDIGGVTNSPTLGVK
jgi:hypothetical protein